MPRRAASISSIVVGLAALVAFARATPTEIFYGDVAQFQLLGLTGGLAHANGYPVYITLENLFALLPIGPLSEAAYRVNLLSAVFGGVTVGLLALFVARQHAAPPAWIGVVAGLVAAVVFALMETTWALATVASPYTLDTATTLLVLLLVAAWIAGARHAFLYVGLFVWGLSFGGHDDTILLAPGLAVLILWRLGPEARKVARVVPFGALSLLAGVAVYLAAWAYQDSRNVSFDFMHTLGWIAPDTWIPSMRTPLDRFIFQATNQEWRWAFFALPYAKVSANFAAYFGALPGLLTPLGVALAATGVVGTIVRRPPLGLALLLSFAAQLAFWLTYDIGDLPKHLLPSYLFLAVWVGLGTGEVLRLAVRLSSALARSRQAGTAVGGVAAVILVWLAVLPSAREMWPVVARQQPVSYQAIQWHVPANLDESEAYARLALADLPRDAVVFADWKRLFTMAYVARFQEGRSDILFTRVDHYAREAAVREYSNGRADFFVSSPARWLPPELFGRLAYDPPLYELRPG